LTNSIITANNKIGSNKEDKMSLLRILIVEDNEENRGFLEEFAKILAPDNIDLQISSDCQNRDLRSYDLFLEIDVLVLDGNLIGITGLQILKRIRKPNNPNCDIPIIFVPGNIRDLGSAQYREKLCREMNVIGIFEKPYVINTIIGRAKDWLRKKQG
jgi:CheY-like chemotaxis protein